MTDHVLYTWQNILGLFDDIIEYGDRDNSDIIINVLFLEPSNLIMWQQNILWTLRRYQQIITEAIFKYAWVVCVRSAIRHDNLSYLEALLEINTSGLLDLTYRRGVFLSILSDHGPDRHLWCSAQGSRNKIWQFLCRENQALHLQQDREIFLSLALWFSTWFQDWRGFLREQLNLESMLGCQRPLTALDGWQPHSLRAMFDMPKLITVNADHAVHAVHAVHAECYVYNAERWTNGLISIEPWWENIKEDIIRTECLCSLESRLDAFDLELDSEMHALSTESVTNCHARHSNPSTCHNPVSFEDGLGSLLNEMVSRNPLTYRVALVNINEDEIHLCSSIRGLISNRFRAQGGVWRSYYRPGGVLCFWCLARMEGWLGEGTSCPFRREVGSQKLAADVMKMPGAFPET